MAFDAKSYVVKRLSNNNVVTSLSSTLHTGAIAGCCGSNVTRSNKPEWNKGINISATMQSTSVDYDPYSDRKQFTQEVADKYRWPKVEFYEADLSELVGQPLQYEVVIQKEFTPYWNNNQENPYDTKK